MQELVQVQDAAPREVPPEKLTASAPSGLLFPGTDPRQLHMNQARVGICWKSPFQVGMKKVRTQITGSQKEL